jgi:hypothetical protein
VAICAKRKRHHTLVFRTALNLCSCSLVVFASNVHQLFHYIHGLQREFGLRVAQVDAPDCVAVAEIRRSKTSGGGPTVVPPMA